MKSNNKILFQIIILFSLLLIQKARSEVYTIQGSHIDSLNIYYIHNILREIPELHVSAMDATDFDVSTANRSSLVTSGLVIAFDGIPTPPFHDGTVLSAMRRFMNKDIDSVVILTGPDRYSICGSCDAVINFIPKKPSDKPFDFYAKSYVGSEVGDPVIYLNLLPQEKVPYNREQIGAGEVGFSFHKKTISIDAGVSPVYTDRYSSTYEKQRSQLYGKVNSRQSLDEHRKFFLTTAYSSENLSITLRPFCIDYNIFRFHQIHGRYYHYRGTSGGAHSSASLTAGSTLFKINAEGYIDNTVMSADQTEKIDLALSGYTASGLINTSFSKSSLSLSVRSTGQYREKNHETQNVLEIYNSFNNLPFSPFGIHAAYSLDNKLFEIGAAYPFRLYCRGGKHLSENSRFFYGAGASEKTGLKNIFYEQSAYLGLKHGFKTGGIKYSFNFESKRDIDTLRISSASTDRRRYIPQANLSGSNEYLGCGYFHADPYRFSLRWQKAVTLNGLCITGIIDFRSKTFWNSSFLPVMQANGNSAAFSLPACLTGTLMASYSIFREHVTLSLALRDIGKKHKELPQGNIICPVAVTNMKVVF